MLNKSFLKKVFVKGYSPIFKYRSHRSRTKFFNKNFITMHVTVYLMRIRTYNCGRKSAYFFMEKEKRTKTDENRMLYKFTLKENVGNERS